MATIGESLAAFLDDLAIVAFACDGHKGARMALGRIIDSRQDALERAARAEAELDKLKADIHAAVQAAPPVLVTLAEATEETGDSDDD